MDHVRTIAPNAIIQFRVTEQADRDHTVIQAPNGSRFLSVFWTSIGITLFAEAYTAMTSDPVARKIVLRPATGPIPPNPGNYLGTVQHPEEDHRIYHVYEIV